MRRGLVASVAAIVACAAGLWFWASSGPSGAREIERRLNDLVEELNAGTTEGMGTIARVGKIGQFFTTDVIVDLGKGSPPIHGRDTLMGMAARLQPRTAAFVLEVADVSVELREDGRAGVTLTLMIRQRSFGSGEESLDARELALEVVRSDGEWRINRVTAIDTFR